MFKVWLIIRYHWVNKGASMEELTKLIIKWHHDRNLIDGSSDKDQVLKLAQELGELSDSVCKGKDVKDDLGDMMVVMLNIMERQGVSMKDCLKTAYNDIKDRKGMMVDGIFVKEGDSWIKMNKSNYYSYKSSLLLGEENSIYANKLTKKELERARKEVEIELRNKNFKNKNF